MKVSGKWRDAFCYINKGWVCSIPKGIQPNNTDIHPTKFESK